MATYAIGDIQGCYESLQSLLKAIHFDPTRDRLWCVGDLVNRGPESLAVLRFLRRLGPSVTTVLGNHDLHLLAVAHYIVPKRPKDTFDDVLGAADAAELIDWVRQRPLLYRDGEYVLIHGGLLPAWTIPAAETYARQAEAMLRSDGMRGLLHALYDRAGSQGGLTDGGPLQEVATAVRALTRLRVCSLEGEMNLEFSRTLAEVPAGYLPWFRVPGRKSTDVTVIFGHWAALGLHVDDHVIGLDSGCIWGRALTAMRLEDRQIFQVSCRDR